LTRQVIKTNGSVIVYDDSLVSQMTEDLFQLENWANPEIVPGYSGGRGTTLFVSHEGQDWALRHYHRGGVVGRFLRDQFIWLGETRTRPFLEWDLLAKIQQDDLPAPAPVAARYVRTGPWYTADLITLRLPGVIPFSNRLQQGPVSAEVWQKVGRCIGQFHVAGYFHADLSTHNLQIDADDNVFLLDFDRGAKLPDGSWRERNLARLLRSCHKITEDGSISFSTADWDELMQGYKVEFP
jgi:3-deoxy-D-manno-octulosonic acid kinase